MLFEEMSHPPETPKKHNFAYWFFDKYNRLASGGIIADGIGRLKEQKEIKAVTERFASLETRLQEGSLYLEMAQEEEEPDDESEDSDDEDEDEGEEEGW